MPSDLAWERYGSGSFLVVLHGGGPGCSASGDFAEVIPALADHREVLAIDLHQFGRSPSVRIIGPSVDHHMTAVVELLDELGVVGADFVCQSLGSLVALRIAERRPDLVRRLVLTGVQPVTGDPKDSSWTLGPHVRQELFADGAVDQIRMRRLIAEAEWADASRIPATLVSRRLEVAVRHHSVVPGDDPHGRGDPQRLDEALPRVHARTMFLWGADDAFATPGYAVSIAQSMPDAEVHVIPHAGHHVQSERPEPYVRAALGFLLAA